MTSDSASDKDSTRSTLATELTRTDEYEAICASEDLAHIGAIQRLGFLLVGDLRSETLVQLSANTPDALGSPWDERHPEALLGESMRSIIGSCWPQAVRATATRADPLNVPLTDAPLIDTATWIARAHRSGDYLIVECLPRASETGSGSHAIDLRDAVTTIAATDSIDGLVATTAQTFRHLTGFDRVMVYRFLPDWSGEVIAESVGDSQQQLYLGNRFPAQDIPPQARKLYDQMGVRLIADTTLGTARMLPAMPAGTSSALDMSRCLLRAVSRAHVEYLTNMDVQQSMSIAIHVGEDLWGLIACHQSTAQPIALAQFSNVIAAAEQIAMLVESRLAQQLEIDEQDYRHAVQDAIQRTLSTARAVGYQKRLLVSLFEELRWNQHYSCIAVGIDDWTLLVHSAEQVEEDSDISRNLIRCAREQITLTGHALLESRNIRADIPSLAEQLPVAGVLAYRPVEFPKVTVLLGLSEVTESITWAGNPNVIQKREVDGQVLISPRASFRRWQSNEHGRSRFWNEWDRRVLFQIADGLRIWSTSRPPHGDSGEDSSVEQAQ